MKTVAIVGASGYIGRNLVEDLSRSGEWRIKLLSRVADRKNLSDHQTVLVQGDLQSPASLHGFFEPGCTVVNLAYLWRADESENLVAMTNLIAACRMSGVKRLVHISTAAVVGRVSDDEVTEATVCNPVDNYGVTKLNIENLILREGRAHFDVAIVRPTAVFGRGGAQLSKLVGALTTGSRIKSYLKSCLFGRRSMNLVHIANVTAAIKFLAEYEKDLDGGIFIVSEDDNEANTFIHVENTLMRGFGVPAYPVPRFPIPLGVLKILLLLLRRNIINPRYRYSCEKILNLGFRRPVTFEAGLADYIAGYYSCSLPREADEPT
jgi:nucleoside-diphosphate-sugar epimerase